MLLALKCFFLISRNRIVFEAQAKAEAIKVSQRLRYMACD